MQLFVEQPERTLSLFEVDESTTAKVLVVDDSRFQRQLVDRLLQTIPEWSVVFAPGGKQAISIAEREAPSVILTDLVMPEIDGFELLQLVKARLPTIPVILMTSHGSEDVAMRALRSGAANYIPKKYLQRDLIETVRTVLSLSDAPRRRPLRTECFRLRESAFEIANDVKLIPSLIRLIEDEFADVGTLDRVSQIRTGVALQEALTNACYHGNLEVSSDLRQEDEKVFYDLIEERRNSDPFASRRVTVQVRVDRGEARFTIRDEGRGFDAARLACDQPPEDLMRIGGRGLLLIRAFMDDVQFNSTGNQITMTRRFDTGENIPGPS